MNRPRMLAKIALAGTTLVAAAQMPEIAPPAAPAVAGVAEVFDGAGAGIESPLTLAGDNDGYGIRAILEADAFDRLSGSGIRVHEFPLDAARSVTLALRSFQVTGPGATLVEGTDAGDVPLPMPRVHLLRGEVEGEPGSWVFLGVTPGRINGIVHLSEDEEFIIAPLQERIAAGDLDTHVIFERFSTDAGSQPSSFICTAVPRDGRPAPRPSSVQIAAPEGDGGPQERGASDRVAWLAIDCDWEFRNLPPFSTTGDAAAYVMELIGVVNVIYERDVQTRMYINFLRVWNTSADPYDADDTQEQLPEFENYFSNNVGVSREVNHLLSGRDLGGGRGFIDVLCDAYSVSGNMAGTFPRPAPQNFHADNWDIVVVAHEIGHNFGSPHTHCYDPPIDTCAGTLYDCSHPRVCQQGELMSYCHTCPGGIANIRLGFVHPAVLAEMREDVSCLRLVRSLVYVNIAWSGGENGTITLPYNRVLKGFMGVTEGGTMRIMQGSYPTPVTLDRAVRLEVWNNVGTVTIGD
ncbi:MAG: hypothetical protein AMXMBFR47_34140 [Planctomycetota bacterium]